LPPPERGKFAAAEHLAIHTENRDFHEVVSSVILKRSEFVADGGWAVDQRHWERCT
jgi:hypothetical protein